jgi:preprotein translocase subunit SecA
VSSSGGACANFFCRGCRLEVMTVVTRQRLPVGAKRISVATPYRELSEHHDSRMDRALLAAWGQLSPRLLPVLQQRRLRRFVESVEGREKTLTGLSDQQLRQHADELRVQLSRGSADGKAAALAFALAREAARRHLGLYHFPVQLLGGAAMLGGALAEMEAGEGKTLTALLPAVVAGLMGRPVHIVTVNDYLARRDAEQLCPIYNALGLSVGLVENGQEPQDRQRAYACDVTYCTNKELVFDYLRDRLTLGVRRARSRLLIDDLFGPERVRYSQRLLLRGLHFAIIDEADSVLIDEARTPLILSGMPGEGENDDALYHTAREIAAGLSAKVDFQIRADERAIHLTPQGERRVAELTAQLPGLWRVRRARDELVQQALSAVHLFRRDVQYIVTDRKVQIVDEFTGRVMPDRSWERGMHQMVEAKEGCAITGRRQTLARITYQRFFRRYDHLCGMTGTASEAAGELRAVYGLRVVQIPTNRPLRRTNLGTQVFAAAEPKWIAVVDSVRAATRANRAVLIGTRSVDASEHVGALLAKAGLQPVVLNARQDRLEAEIVAAAGQPARVTVATNMAGRGTDIQLHPTVVEAGGLHVILTEYHESRRIDRQLFGRAGRQGDPGTYESIVALDDELFIRFAGQRILGVAAKGLRPAHKIPRVVARLLKFYSQTHAERVHARTRRLTLADDHRLDEILGFSGKE